MVRLSEEQIKSWSTVPVKALLKEAKVIVEAEVSKCTIFHGDNNVESGEVNKTQLVSDQEDIGITTTTISPNEVVATKTKYDQQQQHGNIIIPRFDIHEMTIGHVMGRGGFCVVSEIRDIQLRSERSISRDRKSTAGSETTETNISSSSSSIPTKNHNRAWNRFKLRTSEMTNSIDSNNCCQSTTIKQSHKNTTKTNESCSSRAALARQVWSRQGGKFVMKQVNPDLIVTDKVTFTKGVIDIAMEAKYLASFHHPNIIEIRGENRRSPFETLEYFLIMDYLPETLPKRLNQWMHTHRATRGITGFVTSVGFGNERKITRLLLDRLLIAYDIAAACDYLHCKKNVIYRDLKPDNIGFNANGVTKLIDFGLARELTNIERDESGLYLLTGCTGSIRYMAPEVGLHMPYNFMADVYSWSMIFWYILALEPPLTLYTHRMIFDRVFEKGHRPATKEKWNPALSSLLRTCWSQDINERLTFKDIMMELHNIVRSEDKHAASLMINERIGHI